MAEEYQAQQQAPAQEPSYGQQAQQAPEPQPAAPAPDLGQGYQQAPAAPDYAQQGWQPQGWQQQAESEPEPDIDISADKVIGLRTDETGRPYIDVDFNPDRQTVDNARRITEAGGPQAAERQGRQPRQGYQQQPPPPAVKAPGYATQAAMQAQANIAPQRPYTAAEFAQALQAGAVDERRVPEEYYTQYTGWRLRRAQADYAARRAAEERAQQQAQAQAQQIAQAQDPAAQQLAQQPDRQDVKDFYLKLDAAAEEAALRELGLTKEEYQEKELDDDFADMATAFASSKEWHRRQIMADIQNRTMAQQQGIERQRSIQQGIADFVAGARASEPNFDAIDRSMLGDLQALPYAQARPYMEAVDALQRGVVTEQQALLLKEAYEWSRRNFYARRNGISQRPAAQPRPPVVESGAGYPQGPRGRREPDYDALRNAKTRREKLDWLKGYLFPNEAAY